MPVRPRPAGDQPAADGRPVADATGLLGLAEAVPFGLPLWAGYARSTADSTALHSFPLVLRPAGRDLLAAYSLLRC